MSTQFVNNNSSIDNRERGAALLLYAMVMALLAAMGAYGFYMAQKSMDAMNPVMMEINRAQSAAFVGVSALQQDAESQLVACTQSGLTADTCVSLNGPVTATATSTFSGTAITISAWKVADQLGPSGNVEWIVESVGSAGDGVRQKLQAIIETESQQQSHNLKNYAMQTNGNLTINQSLTVNGSIGVNGDVSINSPTNISGNLDAHNITINNTGTKIGTVDYTNSLTVAQSGDTLGQINYGNTATAPNFTYDPTTVPPSTQLSSSQTTQLNNQINAIPTINPAAYQPYAGIQLLVTNNIPTVTIAPFMSNINANFAVGSNLPISCNYNSSSSESYAQQCPGQYDMQILAGATSSTVNPYYSNFGYSNGTWESNGNLAVNGFYYIQGNLIIDNGVGTSDNPANISVTTTGYFTANEGYYTNPFALSADACNALNAATDPVCTGQGTPVPMAAGVSIVTGAASSNGAASLTLDQGSSLGGDALSAGAILFNQQATVGGIIVADNQNNATSGVTFNQMTITNKNQYAQAATGGPPPPPPAFVIQSMAWGP